MIRMTAYLVLLALLALPGCTTMTTRKVTQENDRQVKGVRYALPSPHLLVTPSPDGDGTFTVEPVFLPDESQTYAIDAMSIASTHTVDIKIDANGLLDSVTFNQDSTAVVADSVKAASGVAKDELGRIKKAEEAESEAAKTKVNAANEAIKTARAAIDAKALEIDIANVELKSLQSAMSTPATEPQKESVRAKEVQIAKLNLEKADLERKLKKAEEALATLPKVFNEPEGNNKLTAWGPVLYSIRDTCKSGKGNVELVAVQFPGNPGPAQLKFETVSAPKLSAAQAKGPMPTPVIQGTRFVEFEGNAASLLVDVNSAIRKISGNSFTLLQEGNPDILGSKDYMNVTLNAGKTVELTFIKALPTGKYTLKLPILYGSANEPDDFDIKFEVIPGNAKPRLQIFGEQAVAQPTGAGAFIELVRNVTGKPTNVVPQRSVLHRPDGSPITPAPASINLNTSKKQLQARFNQSLAPGRYQLGIPVTYQEGATEKTEVLTIEFKVQTQ